MTLYAGTVNDFSGSLAEAIETAFANELWALKGATLPDSSAQERHMLFCAIAQGVLGYLKDNEAELQVTIDVSSTDTGHVDFDYATSPSGL
jgi:hypothetical protein